ncbi:50S ribosomal protein L25 [Candidatus Trichorickettsia mobilis]|uniref:Large ribosomal subunit protein bL25 n=1 Tax=Candidatus Trichorickettsia mobilis TaxID=1346319 RepID=A0ABZ0UU49_9RICK|nr:50S ribosomal protein L25/general stress protein Ctc [Candidatus Trichorickettsia mobilis]WPY01111.1 50S ribosomal protein L25 [Candidatus Trichorickettsia mobilis]
MSEILTLPAETREQLGTGAARALRRNGMVPAIIYGVGKKNLAIAILEKEITKLYRKPNFISTVIQLEVGGKKHKILPKAIELHPVTDMVRHVDFIYLDSKVQKLEVPIVFEGKERSVGVKRGGFFNIVKRTITLECEVNHIPACVTIDVSEMRVGASLKAKNIELPKGCKLFCKPDLIIASIIGNRGAKADDENAAAAKA